MKQLLHLGLISDILDRRPMHGCQNAASAHSCVENCLCIRASANLIHCDDARRKSPHQYGNSLLLVTACNNICSLSTVQHGASSVSPRNLPPLINDADIASLITGSPI